MLGNDKYLRLKGGKRKKKIASLQAQGQHGRGGDLRLHLWVQVRRRTPGRQTLLSSLLTLPFACPGNSHWSKPTGHPKAKKSVDTVFLFFFLVRSPQHRADWTRVECRSRLEDNLGIPSTEGCRWGSIPGRVICELFHLEVFVNSLTKTFLISLESAPTSVIYRTFFPLHLTLSHGDIPWWVGCACASVNML